MSLHLLPEDICIKIIDTYLPFSDYYNLSISCKYWNLAFTNKYICRNYIIKKYSYPEDILDSITNISYSDKCKVLHFFSKTLTRKPLKLRSFILNPIPGVYEQHNPIDRVLLYCNIPNIHKKIVITENNLMNFSSYPDVIELIMSKFMGNSNLRINKEDLIQYLITDDNFKSLKIIIESSYFIDSNKDVQWHSIPRYHTMVIYAIRKRRYRILWLLLHESLFFKPSIVGYNNILNVSIEMKDVYLFKLIMKLETFDPRSIQGQDMIDFIVEHNIVQDVLDHPHFDNNGDMLCYMRAFVKHVISWVYTSKPKNDSLLSLLVNHPKVDLSLGGGYFIMYEDKEMIEHIINHYNSSYTLIEYAASINKIHILDDILLKSNIDFDKINFCQVISNMKNDDYDCVKILLEKTKEIKYLNRCLGLTIEYPKCFKLILDDPRCILDSKLIRELINAACPKNKAIIEILIEKGLHLECFMVSDLLKAIRHNKEVIMLLYNLPHIKNSKSLNDMVLEEALNHGCVELAKELLNNPMVDPNRSNLHVSAYVTNWNTDIPLLLLSKLRYIDYRETNEIIQVALKRCDVAILQVILNTPHLRNDIYLTNIIDKYHNGGNRTPLLDDIIDDLRTTDNPIIVSRLILDDKVIIGELLKYLKGCICETEYKHIKRLRRIGMWITSGKTLYCLKTRETILTKDLDYLKIELGIILRCINIELIENFKLQDIDIKEYLSVNGLEGKIIDDVYNLDTLTVANINIQYTFEKYQTHIVKSKINTIISEMHFGKCLLEAEQRRKFFEGLLTEVSRNYSNRMHF